MSDSRWFTTSVETLVTANPDVIIFNDYGVEGQVQENMDFITNNAALADVPAVQRPAPDAADLQPAGGSAL